MSAVHGWPRLAPMVWPRGFWIWHYEPTGFDRSEVTKPVITPAGNSTNWNAHVPGFPLLV